MKYTFLELLTFETLQIEAKNETRTEISQKIREFLKEESIIDRTQYCRTYFEGHVSPVAAILKVTYKKIEF